MIAILYIQDDTTYQDYVLMHYYCIVVLWLKIDGFMISSNFAVHESEASHQVSRVLFRFRVLAINSIDTVCFQLLCAWEPLKRRFCTSIFSNF